MGILDEAIREHLDLKLRRGADPDEVARQQGEVFGPPRRAAGEPETAGFDEPDAIELAAEELAGDEYLADDPEPVQVSEHQTHLRLADAYVEPESAPIEHEQPQAPPEPESLGQETRAFDPEEVRAATGAHEEPDAEQEKRDAEDVLDETPEFLAETPEHDRLWFEQRPPRDFDF